MAPFHEPKPESIQKFVHEVRKLFSSFLPLSSLSLAGAYPQITQPVSGEQFTLLGTDPPYTTMIEVDVNCNTDEEDTEVYLYYVDVSQDPPVLVPYDPDGNPSGGTQEGAEVDLEPDGEGSDSYSGSVDITLTLPDGVTSGNWVLLCVAGDDNPTSQILVTLAVDEFPEAAKKSAKKGKKSTPAKGTKKK